MTMGILELQRLGYRPEQGLDLYFAGKAGGRKKIVELESFDYQIDLMNGLSDREQELFLLYTIRDMATVREDMDELMRAWRTGDAKGMEKIIARPIIDFPETRPIFEKLINRRNREMAGKIEMFLREGGSTFVVVGAGPIGTG